MIPMLALAPHSWFGPWMNRQQILSRLSNSFEVLYSQGVLPSWEVGSERWNKAKLFQQVMETDQIKVQSAGKLPIKFRGGTVLDRFMVAASVCQWKRNLQWREGEGVGYFFSPNFRDYVLPLNAKCSVYHVYDQFQALPGWTKTQEANHRWMLDHADVIIASSNKIAQSLESLSGRTVNLIENGVDYSAFSGRYPEPIEFSKVKGAKIVYTGNINRKVDLPLVNRLSKARPDWSWFFIGKVSFLDDVTEEAYKELSHSNNVHFLGYKPVAELPQYVAHSSVNIMNYRLGNGLWADSGYPLKLNEYLASGQAIVSCDIDAVRQYRQVIPIAKSDEQWISLIEQGIAENCESTVSLRRKIAKGNSWESKAAEVIRLISAHYF